MDHPPIIDRKNKRVRLWNANVQYYITLTFEVIEDLTKMIQDPKNYPGIEYTED